MRKLTLNADDEVIEAARRLASESGTSISSLFARFVRALDQGNRSALKPGRLTGQASGLMKTPHDFVEGETLSDALLEKYEGKR